MANSTSSRPASEANPERFPIYTQHDYDRFLREISHGFLSVVNPSEGLLDILTQFDLLTVTEVESVNGKDVCTRQDQARKVLQKMQQISVEDFNRIILPQLCRHYPHILPPQWQCYDAGATEAPFCLRHKVKDRIGPERIADKLYQINCISAPEYREMTDGKEDRTTKWSAVLKAMLRGARNGHLEAVLQAVKGLLDHYMIHVPGNLSELLSNGLPCTCNRVRSVVKSSGRLETLSAEEKVKAWPTSVERFWLNTEDDVSSGYPMSDVSDRDITSLMSVDSSFASGCIFPEKGAHVDRNQGRERNNESLRRKDMEAVERAISEVDLQPSSPETSRPSNANRQHPHPHPHPRSEPKRMSNTWAGPGTENERRKSGNKKAAFKGDPSHPGRMDREQSHSRVDGVQGQPASLDLNRSFYGTKHHSSYC